MRYDSFFRRCDPMLDLAQVRTCSSPNDRAMSPCSPAVDAVLATSPEVSRSISKWCSVMPARPPRSPSPTHHRVGMPARRSARSARNVAARKPLRAGGHHGPFMTRGVGGAPEPAHVYAVTADASVIETVPAMCTCAPLPAIGAILAACLTRNNATNCSRPIDPRTPVGSARRSST
jgi:hypothetical protein